MCWPIFKNLRFFIVAILTLFAYQRIIMCIIVLINLIATYTTGFRPLPARARGGYFCPTAVSITAMTTRRIISTYVAFVFMCRGSSCHSEAMRGRERIGAFPAFFIVLRGICHHIESIMVFTCNIGTNLTKNNMGTCTRTTI